MKGKCNIIKQCWSLFHVTLSLPLQGLILVTMGILEGSNFKLNQKKKKKERNMMGSLQEKMWQGNCWVATRKIECMLTQGLWGKEVL